ncbi:MAG: DNA polymerase IV [Cyanobacteria bacterium]|nr:DNA polymerase IV [Cyanobacteriota bacterium]
MSQLRKIIHVDMDAFYASVEQRDNPQYRGKPVAVGGSAENRGVVAAASYEARAFGVYSAMPSRTAKQKCPDLIMVRPRFDVYRELAKEIREIFFQFTDLVEPLALDEAYLDVTENKHNSPSATLVAKEIKEIILQQTRLTASAGISINKFLAKIASAMRKPDGLFLIPPDRVEPFIESLPIEKFYGVGEITAKRMHEFGVHTGADLKKKSELELIERFGKAGRFYYEIARGRDSRPVEPNRTRKSIGAENSYAQDLEDLPSIISNLENIAQTLASRLKDGAGGRTLTLKVKYSDYQHVTRSRTVLNTIRDVETIMRLATDLLNSTDVGERKVRLLGLALSNLDRESSSEENVQLTLPLYQ